MQQSRKELSPAALALLQKLTAKPDKSEPVAKLLAESRASDLNNAERAQVLEATRAELAKSIHAHPHVMRVGGSAAMTKRAAMPPVDPWAIAPSVNRLPGDNAVANQPGTEPSTYRFRVMLNPTKAEQEFLAAFISRQPQRGFPRA